jgi:hypothetical protein
LAASEILLTGFARFVLLKIRKTVLEPILSRAHFRLLLSRTQIADLGGKAPSPQNELVIALSGWSRRIAHNRAKPHGLLSTLIEACASRGARVAISNEEQSDV